ncbi:hypothetical protein [Chryseobacterium sp. OSA05B]|uniref:hypothetical protein n=1 Tax=Chryseobacterium sp. OSA05B TaxID=2862650 RepID=UPI001CC01EE6|nr:hypothetical protein [Chryseobacterium sp. OSA05B]
MMRDYFSSLDTDVKRFIHSKFIGAGMDYFNFLDTFLHSYGIISFNVVTNIDNNKYSSYIKFSNENIFDETGKITLATNVSSNTAEERLANKVIALIHFTNYNDWVR